MMNTKFLLTRLTLCVAFAAGFVSCRKEMVFESNAQDGGVPLELTAAVEDTKTENAGMSTLWADGDAIAVMHAETGSSYTMDGQFSLVDKSTGRFSGYTAQALEQSKSYEWLSLYPYDAKMVRHISDAIVQIGGYQVQNGKNSMAHLANVGFPLWGKASSSGIAMPSITMTNLASIIEFRVANNSGSDFAVDQIFMEMPENARVRGKFHIAFPEGSPTLAYDSEGANYNTLEVTGTDVIANGGTASYFMGIAPCTIPSGSVIKVKVNDYEKTITLTADKNFTSGNIKVINFNFDIPTAPSKMYVVDNNKKVITLNHVHGYRYESENIADVNALGSTFFIAEKVNGTTIDDSGMVLGGPDFRNLQSTTSSGVPINYPQVFTNYKTPPSGIIFNMDTKTMTFRTILDKNRMGKFASSTTLVAWVVPLVQGGELQVLNFGKAVSELLPEVAFTDFDDVNNIATYRGVDRNYEAYYSPEPGWINLQDIAGTKEGKYLCLIGHKACYSLKPYGKYYIRDDNFLQDMWGHKEGYGQLTPIRFDENTYKILLYLEDDFAIQFYTAKAWAANMSGWTSATPENLKVHTEGITFGTQNVDYAFYPGIYLLELNTSTMRASLTRYYVPEPEPEIPVEEVFPILAWTGVDMASPYAQSSYKAMRNAGITGYIAGFGNQTDMFSAMDMAKNAGVKLITCCPEMQNESQFASMAPRLIAHDAFDGYFVGDEHHTTQQFNADANFIKMLRKYDSYHTMYLNYRPNWAWSIDNYSNYVNNALNITGGSMFSFDFYPVIEGKSGKSCPIQLNEYWYRNLEDARNISRNRRIPFWAFALSLAHTQIDDNGRPGYIYPVPTLGHLRLQHFSNLVYGAQAFQYFTYWGMFQNVEVKGVYDYVKKVNMELQSLGRVFKNCNVTGVWHTGTTIPQGTQALTSNPAGVTKLQTGGEGAVISTFTATDSYKYIAIVNRSFANTMSLNISFSSSTKEIKKDGTEATVTQVSANVEAGDIKVYRLP